MCPAYHSNKAFRSQSAMEFLMTYGWSVLIIAVVVAALFQLGVFSPTNYTPKAQPGNCKVLRTGGFTNLEGTCSGVPPQSVAVFNGGSSVNVGNSASIILGNSGTISAWIDPYDINSINASQIHIIFGSLGGADVNKVPYFRIQSYLGAYVSNGIAGVQAVQSNLYPTTNKWQFVAMTWNGVTVSLYLNNQAYSVAQTNTLAFTGGGYVIGAGGLIFTQREFSGLIANVQIYNASLDASQISALYIRGIGASPIAPQSVVGWWPLNGNVTDYSGNGNNGAVNSITYTSAWTSGYTPP